MTRSSAETPSVLSPPVIVWGLAVLGVAGWALWTGIEQAYDALLRPSPSRTGDWLIHYEGGWVRRGLPGQVFLYASRWTSLPPNVFVFSTQVAGWTVLILATSTLALRAHPGPAITALLLSPAFLAFNLHDPQGSGRKEVLLLATLAVVCTVGATLRRRGAQMAWALWAIVLVLSHEMLIAFLPYVLVAVLLHTSPDERRLAPLLVATMPAALMAVVVGVGFQGDLETARGICAALGIHAPSDCANLRAEPLRLGAVGWLTLGTVDAVELVRTLTPPESRLVYLTCALLASIPLVWVGTNTLRGDTWHGSSDGRLVVSGTLVALVASAPLLLVFADFGRLIYLHTTCVSLLLLTVGARRLVSSPTPSTSRSSRWLLAALLWTAVALFVTSWTMATCSGTVASTFGRTFATDVIW